MRRGAAPKTGVAKIKISGRQKQRSISCCFVGLLQELVLQNVAKQLANQAAQKRFTPCCLLCETVGFEVLLLIFPQWKEEEKPNPPNVVHAIELPMFKKSSFNSSFHFSRTGCSWMCHLSVPWQPPGNPPKIYKWFLMGYCMFLQNVAKRSENQAAQKCSISDCVLCEKGGFGALRFIFSESTCLDDPGCATLVFRGSPPQAALKKTGRPKVFHSFLVPI